jgi:hypothetical protein
MKKNVYLAPSLYAHILHSLAMLFALWIIFTNAPAFMKLDPYKLIVLVLMLSIVFGIHAISHTGLEKVYKFNPIARMLKSDK